MKKGGTITGDVVFRVDASAKIGIGHLIRCLALSEELSSRGKKCYLLSKIEDSRLIEEVNKYNIKNYNISRKLTLMEDLEQLIAFSTKNNIEWIITDHYDIDADYLRVIKEKGFKLLSIDDTAQIHYYSDIVLNQNIGAKKLAFSAEKYTRFLLGPKYIMIRNYLLGKNLKRKNNETQTILIVFGGSDYWNLTLKAVKSLETIGGNVKLLVISGPINRHYDGIKRYIYNSKCEIDLISSPRDIANVYQKTDLALTAGGSTCYELAYYGIPNLIITVADNQVNIARELDRQQVSIYLGKQNEVSGKQIKETVEKVLISESLRKKMSIKGKKLVDGQGKVRIVDFMERFP